MTTPETEHLLAIVADLLATQDPVTFYEALTVVAAARPISEPEAHTLHALLRLHDAPHLTDGARDILGPFLKSHAQRMQQQRALAKRPILIKDAGKTARAPQGSVLILSLEERRASGLLWQAFEVSTKLRCERRLDRADAPNRAEFELELLAPGWAEVALSEEVHQIRPSRNQGPGTQRLRTFELRVMVEVPEPADAAKVQ